MRQQATIPGVRARTEPVKLRRSVGLPKPFDRARCLAFADQTFASPSRWKHVVRIEPRGELVARFVLPLSLCLTSNVLMQSGKANAGWQLGKLKKQAFEMMFAQYGKVANKPLGGRPMVRTVRFTSRRPDRSSDWTKIPLDRLSCGKNGLGIIADDSEGHIDHVKWAEYSQPGAGFVFIDVHSGDEA